MLCTCSLWHPSSFLHLDGLGCAKWLWPFAALVDNIELPGSPPHKMGKKHFCLFVLLSETWTTREYVFRLSNSSRGFSETSLLCFCVSTSPALARHLKEKGYRGKVGGWGTQQEGQSRGQGEFCTPNHSCTRIHTRQFYSPSFRTFLQLASWTFLQTDLQVGSCYLPMLFQRYLDMPEFSWKHNLSCLCNLNRYGIGWQRNIALGKTGREGNLLHPSVLQLRNSKFYWLWAPRGQSPQQNEENKLWWCVYCLAFLY